MPVTAAPFPEWLPDLEGNILSRASNVRAVANGYAPFRGPVAATVALAAAFNGGGSFIDSGGNATLLSATAANVYKYTGTAWSSVLAATANQVVRFAQFGDNVIIANGGVCKSYSLTGGTTTTPTDAPTLIDVAQARDMVMGITSANELQWCQFNNSSVWTAGANQADIQPSLWGQLRRIVGGEYMIALTDRAVVRGTYVGSANDIIWQFDEISAEIGVMAANSVCNVGRLIFFLSERGFEMCDGQEVTPIGDEKFNRWFFSTFSRGDIAHIWGAVDPRNSLVLWGMPGAPGVLIAYNWVLQKATTLELDFQGMFTGYSTSTALDALDAIYGDLDSIPISLDDPSLQGGSPVLLVADSSYVLNALTGDNLEAKLRLENVEPTPGRRSRIRNIRLVSDTLDASVTVDARMRLGDAENIVSAVSMRSNGKMPVRSNGRFNTIEVTVPQATDWSFIQGMELEFEPGGQR